MLTARPSIASAIAEFLAIVVWLSGWKGTIVRVVCRLDPFQQLGSRDNFAWETAEERKRAEVIHSIEVLLAPKLAVQRVSPIVS